MSRKLILCSLMICALMLVPTTLAQGDAAETDENDVADVTIGFTDLNVDVNESIGSIDITMGASHMFLRFGTAENPGGIQLMTTQKVYVGIADHRSGPNGAQDRVGIPAQTLFYQNLPGIIEYQDSNADGLFNVHSNGIAGTFEELRKHQNQHEPVIKWVSFADVAWDASLVSMDCQGKNCQLTFSLSASNLSYGGVNTSEVLDEIEFIFKLTTEEIEVQHQSVPHYVVRHHYDGDSQVFDSSEEADSLTVNTTVIRATWKYDEVLSGWDVATDANGSELNDTRLMQFVDLGYAAYMKDDVAQWARTHYDNLPSPRAMAGENQQMSGPTHDQHGRPLRCGLDYVQSQHSENSNNGNNGQNSHQSQNANSMREYHNTNCVQTGEEIDTGRITNSSAVRVGALHFDDDGRRFGSLRWVSNATVDGVETEVLFQIHGHRPVLPVDVINLPEGHYRGVRLTGGYNIEAGTNVVHDPEYETELMDFDAMSFEVSNAGSRIRLAGLAGLIGLMSVAVVAVVATVLIVKARKTAAGNPQLPKAEHWGGSDDWQKSRNWGSEQKR